MTNVEALYEQYADDPRPLPLIVASLWNFPLTSVEGDDTHWYAIQDWISGLATATIRKATEMWRQMKLEQIRIQVTQLPYKVTNGKTYQIDYTNKTGLMLILASLRV